jgi:hypothetical protein
MEPGDASAQSPESGSNQVKEKLQSMGKIFERIWVGQFSKFSLKAR